MRNEIRFFTATIINWQRLLKPDKYKQIIVDSLGFLVQANRVWIYGFVVMPNHVHILWRMQQGHEEKNVRRDFLKFTAQQIQADLKLHHPLVLNYFVSTQADRQYQFWERRAYSLSLRATDALEQKLDYIHNNPLNAKWMLAETPEHYKFSSASYYVFNENKFEFITHYKEHI